MEDQPEQPDVIQITEDDQQIPINEMADEDGDEPVASTSRTLSQEIEVTVQNIRPESDSANYVTTEQAIFETIVRNIKVERASPPPEPVPNPAQDEVPAAVVPEMPPPMLPPMPPTAYLLLCQSCHNPAMNRRPTASRSCGHVFCYACITDRIKDTPTCPACLTPIIAHQSLKKLDLDPYRF